MKKLLLILPFLIITPSFSAEKYNVKWSCDQLPYEGVDKLPDSKMIKVKVSNSGKIRFYPNIFRNSIGSTLNQVVNQVGNSIAKTTKLFKENKSTRYSVDYSQCLDNFAKKFSEKSSNPLNRERLIKRVKSYGYFKSQTTKKVLPTIYPNHKFSSGSTYYTQAQIINLSKKICADENISFSDKKIATSSSYFDGLKRVLKYSKLDSSCLRKVFSLNESLIPVDICSDAMLCQAMESSISELNQIKIDFKKIRQDAITKENLDSTFSNRILKMGIHIPNSESDTVNKMFVNYCDTKLVGKTSNLINDFPLQIAPQNLPGEFSKFYSENSDNMGKDCKNDLLSKFLSHYTRNKDSLKLDDCDDLDCSILSELNDEYNSIINTLMNDLFGAKNKELVCSIKDQFTKPYDSVKISDLLAQAKEVLSCQELDIGETKINNNPSYESKTSVEMNYALERKSPTKYQATLALDFNLDKELYPDIKQTPEELLTSVQKCMEFSSSYFKGPDGKSIDVKIISPSQQASLPKLKQPPIVKIGMQGKYGRANSHSYTENIDCPTITHEVLHLMGLVDEYHESVLGNYVNTTTGKRYTDEDKWKASDDYNPGQSIKFETAYNQCRSKSSSPSVMSGQDTVFNNTVQTANQCSCVTSKLCEDIMSEANQNIKDIYLSLPLQSSYDKQLLGCEVIQQPTKVTFSDAKEKNALEKITESDSEISFTHYELARTSPNLPLEQSKYLKTSYSCSCDRSSFTQQADRCNKRMATLKKDVNANKSPRKFGCPEGSLQTPRGKLKLTGKESDTITYNPDDYTFDIYSQPVSESLLHPAHFEVLLGGNCKSKAKTYSECAKNAYKRFAENCPNVPAYCKDENKWLKSIK
jgi:hypothetical protein